MEGVRVRLIIARLNPCLPNLVLFSHHRDAHILKQEEFNQGRFSLFSCSPLNCCP